MSIYAWATNNVVKFHSLFNQLNLFFKRMKLIYNVKCTFDCY